jgi:hypothetical protein
MAGRNAIEGKLGQGKNAYGLQKIKARMKGHFRKLDHEYLFYNKPDKIVRKGIFAPIKSMATELGASCHFISMEL